MIAAAQEIEFFAGAKALTHGLEILRILVESPGPLPSTEIAKRVGMHQSSASRILKALAGAGYVRKLDYRSFAPDFGVLTLGGAALQHFPMTSMPLEALENIAARANGLRVSFSTLWRGQVFFFLYVQDGHEPVRAAVGGYPLHLSSPALRLLLLRPRDEARRALEDSRLRYGWSQPTTKVPGTAASLLKQAESMLRHDCLPLVNWQGPRNVSVAIPVETPSDQPDCALSLSGPKRLPVGEILLLLQDGRRYVEASLR